MFGRKKQNSDAVDVNDYIVGDSMQSGIQINGDLGSPVPSVDISDDQIIDADYSTDQKTGKRFKASQIAILVAVAAFGAGGVASIFLPSSPTEASNPLAISLPPEQAAPAAEIKLPPGLAESAPQPTSVAETPVTPTPPVEPSTVATNQAVPSVLASPVPIAAPAPAQNTQATPSILPASVATINNDVVAKPQTESAPINPIASQVAEAQRLQAPTPTPPASKPASAVAPTKPAPDQASVSPKTVTPAPAPKKNSNAPIAAKPTASPPAKPKTAPTSEMSHAEHDASEETIKRLVTTSADAFGLQSIQEGAITLESRRGSGSQRLQVGDRLPSGEQILRIDARSMTLVTDRSVIRIN